MRIEAILASANRHKLDELRDALPGWEIEPLEADDWPEETGETYYENALIKARFGRTLATPRLWVLGEDSGIESVALDGAPGLHSARWAPGLDQADALLERLANDPERKARMVTELVALAPDGRELRGSGVLEGTLATERRGEGGFGYDPIFIPDGDTRTVAEIGDAWKRRNSHRARAAQALEAAIVAGGGDHP
ncbi:MAG TPA: non-canonical purine NTP pyrophosphatase [Gaiellaceae bacterium]|nr:non-canonical purine NTP pyrophosphatase [Gaiellaceae bacterium]